MREKEVKPIEVSEGENQDGIDLVFPVDDLHLIAGSVLAKADGHAVDAGTISLTDPETKDVLRTAMIEQDGSFRLNYLVKGSYILRVSSASDTDKSNSSDPSNNFARMLGSKAIKNYGTAEMPVELKADVTGIVLQVPDAKVDASAK